MTGRLLDASFAPEVRASLARLTLARLGANSIYRFAPPFLAVIASDLDVSLTTLGIVLAVSELVGLSGPLIGRVSERLPRRGAMAIGLLAIAGGAGLAGAAPGAPALAGALVIVSVAKMLFDISLVGWVAERVPYAQRGRAIGLTETSWAGGLLVGVPIMGLVTAAASWRWGYAAAALAVAALAVSLQRRLPEAPAARMRGQSQHRAPLGAGWLLVLTLGTMMASSQAIIVVFGSWLEDEHGLGVVGLAAVVVALGVAELLSSLATASRSDRWGKPVAVAVGVAVMVPAALALAALGDVLVIGLVALVLYIAGFEFAIVSSIPMSTELVPGQPSAGIGMAIGAGTLGRAVLSIPATAAYEWGGLWAPALLAAVLAASTLATMLAYRRWRPQA